MGGQEASSKRPSVYRQFRDDDCSHWAGKGGRKKWWEKILLASICCDKGTALHHQCRHSPCIFPGTSCPFGILPPVKLVSIRTKVLQFIVSPVHFITSLALFDPCLNFALPFTYAFHLLYLRLHTSLNHHAQP